MPQYNLFGVSPLFETLANVPCIALGNLILDAYDSEHKGEYYETAFIVFSSSIRYNEDVQYTLSFKFRLDTFEITEYPLNGYLDPTRFIKVERNPHAGRIYLVGDPGTDNRASTLNPRPF